jgi:hypothetical protein
MKKIVLALSIFPLFTGCSTFVNGTSQNVTPTAYEQNSEGIYTNINARALCTMTNKDGTVTVTSSTSGQIKRSGSDLNVRCQDDKKFGERNIKSIYRVQSLGGNILAGGPIGMVVDGVSGAAFDYPEFIKVFISDKGNPEQPIDAPTAK